MNEKFNFNNDNIHFVTIGFNDFQEKRIELLNLVEDRAFKGRDIVTRPIDKLKEKFDQAQIDLTNAQQEKNQAEQNVQDAKQRLNHAS